MNKKIKSIWSKLKFIGEFSIDKAIPKSYIKQEEPSSLLTKFYKESYTENNI